jgi:4-amino-4-deoxy-L-arabinose transferase-like glycosyltransferase/Flp pilus assembly protein TadD
MVFAAAATIRLLVVASVSALPLVRTPKLDSFEYVSWARSMADGSFAWPAVSAHGPGYPLFLAALFALGGSITTVLVVQALVGALTAVLITVLGERWFGERAGLYAGLLYAAFGPVVFIETGLLSEGLLLFLTMGAMVLLTAAPLTRVRSTAAGVLLGAAVLVRPTTALILATLLVALWGILEPARRWAVAVLVVAGVALVTGPVLLKNWMASRTFGIQGFGGLNFYIGNSPAHNGRPTFRLGAGWDALNSEALRAGVREPASQDRYYLRKTFNEVRERPIRYLQLLAEKGVWLVQAAEVRDSHSFYFFADQSLVLRLLPRMAILVPLAAIGVAESLRRRKKTILLNAYAAGAALTVVFFVMGTRYRAPIVPAFAIWGGLGVAAIVEAIRERRERWLASMAVLVVLSVAVSHAFSDAESRTVAEEWAFTGASFITEHRLSDAEAAYRRALELNANSALAWDGLGLTLYDGQRWSEARGAVERAAALEPISARISDHRGLLDEHEGRLPAAATEFRDAMAIDPTNLDVDRHLASALVQLHRDDEAAVVLAQVVEHDPNDAASHRALAGALGATGRLQEAKRELVTTVGLSPADGEAWLDLCLVSLDLGATGDAAEALQRARERGASRDRVLFAAKALRARQGAR